MTPPSPVKKYRPVFEPLFAPSGSDDLSTHRHRQLIGWLGALLPVLLWAMSGWRPTEGIERWDVLESVSTYYHTGAVAAFVGVLVALAVFLFTYRGYDNEDRQRDQAMAVAAGCAAIGVAVFPTGAPEGLDAPAWCTPLTKTIHYVSAVVLFASFILFALYLFRKTNLKNADPLPPDKRIRNAIYVICGAAMIGCMIWVVGASITDAPIFWPEALALELFALSWLVKGRADWTFDQAGKRTRDYVRRRGKP
jgi:multisubunit Na+/H+ antiporter MnhB subunit